MFDVSFLYIIVKSCSYNGFQSSKTACGEYDVCRNSPMPQSGFICPITDVNSSSLFTFGKNYSRRYKTCCRVYQSLPITMQCDNSILIIGTWSLFATCVLKLFLFMLNTPEHQVCKRPEYINNFLSCWLVVLRIMVDLAIFQPYLDLEAGDNQSLKIQVARPGIEPRSSCSASQELNHSATAAPTFYLKVQTFSFFVWWDVHG